jgi:hypothetical protein
LNDAVELVETDGKLNLNAPTDGWLHLIERDGKSGDLLGLIMRPDWQTDKVGPGQKCVDAAGLALGRVDGLRHLYGVAEEFNHISVVDSLFPLPSKKSRPASQGADHVPWLDP